MSHKNSRKQRLGDDVGWLNMLDLGDEKKLKVLNTKSESQCNRYMMVAFCVNL